MSVGLYNVESAAKKLGVHTRTILRFIQSGKLIAHKVGRQWRIKAEDLNILIGNEKTRVTEASVVIDIPVNSSNDYERLHNMIYGGITGNREGSSRVDLIYNKEKEQVRITAWGEVGFMSNLFSLINNLV